MRVTPEACFQHDAGQNGRAAIGADDAPGAGLYGASADTGQQCPPGSPGAVQTDPAARRLKSIPGIGPITSSVLAATLPDATGFKTARDLAAWSGLTPKPHSSGGKERLGKISKRGNRYIRRLLCLGAMGVIAARRRRPAGQQTGRPADRQAGRPPDPQTGRPADRQGKIGFGNSWNESR